MSWGHLSGCGEGILSSSGREVPLSLLPGFLNVMQNRAPLEFRQILMVPLELQQETQISSPASEPRGYFKQEVYKQKYKVKVLSVREYR